VELMDREKECNLCHVYCKAKVWFQKSQGFFSKQFRRRVKMEKKRENGLTEEDLKLKYFSPL
jgi:uncharacterized protein (UPF0335 family)